MENLEICAKCGGSCCKGMGCHYSPEDFSDLSLDGLKKEIDKGHISIDWWEGNPFDNEEWIPKAYFLRVRNVDAPVVDASWGGRCSLLTEKGCSLSYGERPKGGRMLIPHESHRCKVEYTKDECARDWYEYIDVLRELEEIYDDGEDHFQKMLEKMMEL